MKAIIPAAGIGTRLRPHTLNYPKVMLNVAGKPIIAHIVEELIKVGVSEISIIVGFYKEVVVDYFTDRYPIKFNFPVQEEMKGLGHAISYGLNDSDEPALILLGDTIFKTDFAKFVKSDYNMLGVVEVENPQRFGVVETDSNNMITNMVEKPEIPPSNLAISGIYYIKNQNTLNKAIQYLLKNDIKTRGEYQLTDALLKMVKDGEPFYAEKIDGWYDCGKKETLLETSEALLAGSNQIHGNIENSILIPPVYIGKNSSVSKSVLGPNVTISDDCTVENTIAVNSIINNHSNVKNIIIKNTISGINTRISGKMNTLSLSDFSEFEIK